MTACEIWTSTEVPIQGAFSLNLREDEEEKEEAVKVDSKAAGHG